MYRVLAGVLLAAIVIGGTRPQMVAALKPSWRASRPPGTPVGTSQVPLRFARDPMPRDLVAFLEHVEQAVPATAPIALFVPLPWDNPDASYSRFRFNYLLAGHDLIVVTPWTSEEFYENAYVAAWSRPARPSTGAVIYRGHDGVLRDPNRR